jgi:hypothetical protein
MADTTVTGKIGDQEVQLINAASEATLQKLLEAFNKASGTGSGSGSSSGGTAGTPAQAASNTTTAFNKAGEAVGKFAGAVADATSKLLGFAGNIIGGTASVMLDLSKELLTGGERVSDFTTHLSKLPSIFGYLGELVHTLSAFIDKNIDEFRKLSQVGANFGNSIDAMRLAAAESGMGFDRYTALVKNNAETMALFGGTVSQGAVAFGKFSKDFRQGDTGKKLLGMGFSIDEINDSLISYSNINSRAGRDRILDTRELGEASGRFAIELNKAAAATGLSRGELAKKADALSKQIDIAALANRFQGKDKEKFMAGMAQITSSFGIGSEALLEGARGFINSSDGIALNALAPELMQTMKDFTDTGGDVNEKMNSMILKAREKMEQFQRPENAATLKAQMDTIPGFKTAYAAISEIASRATKNAEQLQKEADAAAKNDTLTGFYQQFSETINNFRGSLESTFIKSDFFKNIKNMMDDFSKGGSTSLGDILNRITAGFKTFLTSLNEFLTDVQNPTLGWSGAMKNIYENILMNIFDLKREDTLNGEGQQITTITKLAMEKIGIAVGEALTAMLPVIKEAVSAGLTALWEDDDIRNAGIKGILALFAVWAAFKVGGGLISGAASRVASGGAAASAGGGMGAGLKGLASGLAAFANPASLIGLAAVTAAVYALSLAFEAASPGFEAFGTMVKRILEGVAPVVVAFGTAVGTVMKDVGTAITNAKDGFTAIFNGIATVVKSIGSVIIGSITAIGDSISKIIDTISKYKTEGTRVATDSVKQLANIPAANMTAAAAGIEAIKKALDGFNPGFLSGISQGLGSIFAGDQTGPLQQMAVLGPKLQNAAAGFTAFKTAIEGMKLANLSMTSDQTSSFETLTRRLPEFTTTITALGAQAANINSTAVAINAFKQATTGFDLKDFSFSKEQLVSLADGTTKLRQLSEQLKLSKDGFQKLDQQGLKNIKEGVEGLSKAFKDFNESFINKFIPKFEELRSKTQEGILTDLGSKLDTLNSSVTSLITIEDTSKKYLDTIASKKAGKVY